MGCKQISSKKPVVIKGKEGTTPILNETPINQEITIIIKKGGNTLSSTTYPLTIKVDLVIHDLEYKLLKETDIHSFVWNGKLLKDQKGRDLKELLAPNTTELIIELDENGLQLPKDIIEEYSKINYIAKPITDPFFQIVVFNKTTQEITVDPLNDDGNMENFKEISKFNEMAAYCNGANKMFISGGEDTNNVALSSFWTIDLETKRYNKHPKSLIYPRKWHSMIYVPSQFVFIVGGVQTKIVEYFDTAKDTFSEHSELNYERHEPSLAMIDNSYLYCFSGTREISESNKTVFERINLRVSDKKWELIQVTVDAGIKFNQMFFGVSYYQPSQVIFLGGVNSGNSKAVNYIYDTSNNSLKESTILHSDQEFGEKFFIPLSKGISVAFPNVEAENINLITFGDNKINSIKFELEAPKNVKVTPTSKDH